MRLLAVTFVEAIVALCRYILSHIDDGDGTVTDCYNLVKRWNELEQDIPPPDISPRTFPPVIPPWIFPPVQIPPAISPQANRVVGRI